jgi:hypothetical protein
MPEAKQLFGFQYLLISIEDIWLHSGKPEVASKDTNLA